MEVPGPSHQDSTSTEQLRCFREIMDAVRKLSDSDWAALNEGIPIKFSRLQFAALCMDIVRSVSGCLLIDSLLLSTMERIGMEEVLLVAKTLKQELGDATTSTSPAQMSTEDPADCIDNKAAEVVSEMSAAMKEAIRRVASDKKEKGRDAAAASKKASSGQEVQTKPGRANTIVAWETPSSLSDSLPETGGQSSELTGSMLVDVDCASSSDVGKRSTKVYKTIKKKVTRFFKVSKKTSPDKDTKQTPPSSTEMAKPSNQVTLGAKEESSDQSALSSESTSTTIKEADLLEDPVAHVQPDVPLEATASRVVEETPRPGKLCSSARRFYRRVQKRVRGFVSALRRSDSPRNETPKFSHIYRIWSDSILDGVVVSNSMTEVCVDEESSTQSSSSSESASTTIKEVDLLEDPVADVQPDVLLEATASRVVEETPRPGKLCSSARRLYRRVQKRVRGFVSAPRRSDSPRNKAPEQSHGHRSRSASISDTALVRNVEQEESLPESLLMMFVEKSIRRLLVDVLGQSLSSVVPAHTGWSACIHDNFTVAVGGLTQTLGRLVMETFKTSSGSSFISDVRSVSTKPGRSPTPLVRQPAGKIVQVSDTYIPDEVPAPVEKRGSGLPVIQANKAHKFIRYLKLKRSNKVHPVCLKPDSHWRSSSKDLQEGLRGTPEVSESSSKKLRRRLRRMFSALSEAVPNPFKHRPPPAE